VKKELRIEIGEMRRFARKKTLRDERGCECVRRFEDGVNGKRKIKGR
jgi:hypothetical protein